jgi:hypothetical protein
MMAIPSINRVRSTTSISGERFLYWREEDIHPYTYLDNWLIRVVPGGRAFTQPVDRGGWVIGEVVSHDNLVSALAHLGWEPC